MKTLKKCFIALRSMYRSSRSVHDVAALVQLRPLVSSYIPISGMAMNPSEIARICNDILINRRQKIVEFGCGASTVYIAKILPDNAVIYSVDHDSEWLDIVRGWLQREGVEDRVRFIHAPLRSINLEDHRSEWYDLAVLERSLPENDIDCVIVDGPPAGSGGIGALARYPAIPVLESKLAERVSIYLDDAVRNGEQTIAKKWSERLGIHFELRLNTGGYAIGVRGQAFMD